MGTEEVAQTDPDCHGCHILPILSVCLRFKSWRWSL